MARYQTEQVLERWLADGALSDVRAHFANPAAVAATLEGLERWERSEDGAVLFRFMAVDEGVTRFVGRFAARWERDALGTVTWRSVGAGNLWWSGSMRCTREGDGRIRITVAERRGVDLVMPTPLETILATQIEANLRAEGERWLDAMIATLPR